MGVRNILSKLQEVQSPPALSVACFVTYEAALITSKSPTIVGELSPKSTDDFDGEGGVTGVPQVRTLKPR